MIARRPTTHFSYVPAAELDGRPHVVVDGAARPGTVCTLSHWPGTPTPRRLWADTSAEIVLRALEHPRLLPPQLALATIDHYDADGVIALALLVIDGLAGAWATRLAGAARAGDFDVVEQRPEALVAFALAALRAHDPAGAAPGSPEEPCRPDGAVDATASAAGRALQVLPQLAARPERFEHLWGPEAEAYDRARRMLETGDITVEERPELDLAIVRLDDGHPELRGASWEGAVVHPAVVHSVTSCLRVATLASRRYEVRYRYESWVRLVSRRPRRRVDLSQMAQSLSDREADGGRWVFDGAGAIMPALRRVDGEESTLSAEEFLAELSGTLVTLDRGPGAWDPYAVAPAGAG